MQWRLDWLPAVVTRLQQIRNSTLNFESTVDSCLTVRKVYAMERGALAGRPAWVGGIPDMRLTSLSFTLGIGNRRVREISTCTSK